MNTSNNSSYFNLALQERAGKNQSVEMLHKSEEDDVSEDEGNKQINRH